MKEQQMQYQDKAVRLCGLPEKGGVCFTAYATQDGASMGSAVLRRAVAADGRPYGVLIFDLLPAYNEQPWFESVLRIAEAHFFKDYDLKLLLVPVQPETDQEKIAALVSYGYDPDREQITEAPDMFVLDADAL